MSDTPRTNNFRSQGREWIPLGVFEVMEQQNTKLRAELGTAADLLYKKAKSNEEYIAAAHYKSISSNEA